MSNEFGDPNRQYGIPGIDNQVPGSPAQAAGIAAYQQSKQSGGSDSQATQAAVNAAAQSIATNPANIPASGETAAQSLTQWMAANGTTSPTSAPKNLVTGAWLNAGAPDYNALAAAGVSGYTTNPTVPNTPAVVSAIDQASSWGGSSLSSGLQSIVDAIRNGAVNAQSVTATNWLSGLAQLTPAAQQTATPATSGNITFNVTPSSPTVASDGQSLSTQSAAIQSEFEAAYGALAAQVWAAQHNNAIGMPSTGGGATTVNVSNPSQGTSGTAATAAAVPASLDASLAGLTGWVQLHPMEALIGGGLLLYMFGGKRR